MPTFFTRYGAFIFTASQVASGVTAVLAWLILIGVMPIPELGWIAGNERSSTILLVALGAMLNAVLDTQGTAARPHGPGTGKWLFIDIFFSSMKAIPVVVVGVPMWALSKLTGSYLDLVIILLALVGMDVWNWIASFMLVSRPTSAAPQMPAPVVDSFSTSAASVAAGGEVELTWVARNAHHVTITGLGRFPPTGTATYRPRGAAGASETVNLIAIGPGGSSAPSSVTINVT